jgi:chitin synthase
VVAAFLESFLWVAAFVYCLAKAYIKADNWTQKILAVLLSVVFIILRRVDTQKL